MRHRVMKCLIIAVSLAMLACDVSAKDIQRKDDSGRDYWVYTPDTIDSGKTYTLVVGVHGYRGKGNGAAGHAGWVNKHDVIVLGPSYDSNGYQYLQQGSDQQTLDLVKKLRKEYKLHDKIFIAGFSGGSQYAHRFAMKYPDLVAGCAAHSGGTWATGDYAERATPNPKARGVLFVISCGEKDTGKSFGEAPFGRLDWAKKYEGMLKDGGFVYHAQWWPGVGHNYAKGARQQTLDCFLASTQRMPAYKAERSAIDKLMRARDYAGAWSIVQARLASTDADNEGILGKVHKLYAKSLEDDISRIDRMAEREVRKVVHQHEAPQDRRAVLEKMKADFAGAPKATQAIDAALAELD